MKPLYISKEEVGQFLSIQTCISLMEEVFTELTNGQSLQPLRSLMWLPGKKGLLGMMPAYSADKKMMGIKVISAFSGNREFGLPQSRAGTKI